MIGFLRDCLLRRRIRRMDAEAYKRIRAVVLSSASADETWRRAGDIVMRNEKAVSDLVLGESASVYGEDK